MYVQYWILNVKIIFTLRRVDKRRHTMVIHLLFVFIWANLLIGPNLISVYLRLAVSRNNFYTKCPTS